MLTLFYEGGVLFMSVLTLMLIVLLSLMGYLSIRSRKIMNPEDFREQLFRISEIGIAAFVIGLCAQLISLYFRINGSDNPGCLGCSFASGRCHLQERRRRACWFFRVLGWHGCRSRCSDPILRGPDDVLGVSSSVHSFARIYSDGWADLGRDPSSSAR